MGRARAETGGSVVLSRRCVRARGCCSADIRGQYLAAARDGKRIHDSLQLAISLDPSLGDAYFGLGLYHYYAAIAPARGAHPEHADVPARRRSRGRAQGDGADPQQGLAAARRSRLSASPDLSVVRDAADDGAAPDRRTAHALSDTIRCSTCGSPRCRANYIRNHQAALQTYRSMLDAARAGRIAAPAMSEVHARLGMAQEMDALCDSAGAVEQLNAVDRAQASGAVRRARARLLSTRRRSRSRGTSSGCDRGVSTRACAQTLATIDCACARRSAQRSRVRRPTRACR